jgi:tyrosine-protein phosphatase YwqE
VNATSITGYHGPASEELAWRFLEAGDVAIVASDGHRLARPPRLDDAYELVRERLGKEKARPLFDGSALGLSSRRPLPSRAAARGA